MMARQPIRGAIIDLSGVLYVGDSVVAGAVEALLELRRRRIPVRFVTNTSRRPRIRLLADLSALGLPIDEDELFTAVRAARALLRSRDLIPMLLVHPDIEVEFPETPSNRPNAVLIADAGEAMDYVRLNDAFRLLMDGAPLIAINRNRYFHDGAHLSLDTGPFVAALEFASGTRAELIGKPAPALFDAALQSLGLAPESVVMIGDDVESDVNGARRVGLEALLVRTGKYRHGDEALMLPGAQCVEDIGEAAEWIIERG